MAKKKKTVEEPTEGWAKPGLAAKFHYFRESMSLCRAWAFTGPVDADNGKPASGDCAKCRKVLDKNPPTPDLFSCR